MTLIDPTTLSGWVAPHSIAWYKQLGELQHTYTYSWDSTISEPNGEAIFDREVTQLIKNKKVLDVGCGDGRFARQQSEIVKKIVGFDVTESFIQYAAQQKPGNVSFVHGDTKRDLPFNENEFDVAYSRKGPTSAYPQLRKIVKNGGNIIGLHPGDKQGKELSTLFPNLFESIEGTPIVNKLKQRLQDGNFAKTEIEEFTSIEYLQTPEDVLRLRCFGQLPFIYEQMIEHNLQEVTSIFTQYATEKGLPITFSRYLVRVVV